MVELLSAYRRVRSSNFEEARDGIARVLSPHRLQPLPHSQAGLTTFNVANLGTVDLCYLTYGVPVRVRAAQASDRDYVLVTLPLAGRLVARSGRDEIDAAADDAALLDSDVEVDIHSGAAAELLMVRMDRAALEAQLGAMLGRPLGARLRLHRSVATTTPAMRSWLRTVRMACRDLDGPRGLGHAAVQTLTAQLLMGQFLSAVPAAGNSDLADLTGDVSNTVAPKLIRRADELIGERASEALTVVDVAAAVGISVRSLQEGFRRHLDTTPSARIRRTRLARVRIDLLAADPSRTTVSRLAHDRGFTHLGRFARDYRRTFGESPSETLRR